MVAYIDAGLHWRKNIFFGNGITNKGNTHPSGIHFLYCCPQWLIISDKANFTFLGLWKFVFTSQCKHKILCFTGEINFLNTWEAAKKHTKMMQWRNRMCMYKRFRKGCKNIEMTFELRIHVNHVHFKSKTK